MIDYIQSNLISSQKGGVQRKSEMFTLGLHLKIQLTIFKLLKLKDTQSFAWKLNQSINSKVL